MGCGNQRDDAGTARNVRQAEGAGAAAIPGRPHFDWVEYRARFGPDPAKMALPFEDGAEIARLVDHWFEAFQPASPIAFHLVKMTVRELIQIRRCQESLRANEALVTKKAREEWRAGQRRELARHMAYLPHDAAAAVAALKESAPGCLWLIECFEAFGRYLDRRGSQDLREHFGPGVVVDPDQKRALNYFAASGSMGPGIDADALSADVPAVGSVGRLRAVMEWELPRLRVLYERLQAEGNGPAEDEAIARAITSDEWHAWALHMLRQHTKSFQQCYRHLLEHCGGPPPHDLPGLPAGVEPTRPSRRRRR
jgi:hypothetical protein